MKKLAVAVSVLIVLTAATLWYRSWNKDEWDVSPGEYLLDSGMIPAQVTDWIDRVEQAGAPGYYICRSTEDNGNEVFYIYSTFRSGSLHLQPDSDKQAYLVELSEITLEEPISIVFLTSADNNLKSINLKTPHGSTVILTSDVASISDTTPAPISDLREEPPSIPVAFERKFTPAAKSTLSRLGVTAGKYAETIDAWDDPDTLVVAQRGECHSSEYGIRVTKIWRNDEGLLAVYVRLLDPKPAKPGTTQDVVITRPVDAVRIKGWRDDWHFLLIVEGTEVGPFAAEDVCFTPYELGTSTPETALGRPLPNELGVSIVPLVAETDRFDSALIVYRPQCPTTGYDIEVKRITRETVSGKITVYVKLSDPAPGSQQSQVTTQPIDVVRIDGYRHEWVYEVIVLDP